MVERFTCIFRVRRNMRHYLHVSIELYAMFITTSMHQSNETCSLLQLASTRRVRRGVPIPSLVRVCVSSLSCEKVAVHRIRGELTCREFPIARLYQQLSMHVFEAESMILRLY